ncbi:MAG: 3-hydroxylacyl-ACP dehydratase [Treponema sp.]|jgi:predicted hotdog family 3-hydroxylacyl-ACP dehydratase|nr:3-hydroxylacyl-ACP dehydratase [Treponema sp.]
MNQRVIEKEELAALVPHQGGMFLLSRVIRHDLDRGVLVSEYDITEESFFYRRDLGGVPSWAGFELMAQSVGALSGLNRRGRPPRIGFILSVSELILRVPAFKAGTTARIEVEEEAALGNAHSFFCRVFAGGRGGEADAAVEAKLTVMETDDPAALLGQEGGGG